ncbi:hypothetical protein D3C75_941450 [compost metagenome]
MVTVHVRCAIKAVIDHPVMQADFVGSDLGLDAADQMQVLAEDRGLLHHPLGP